MRYGYVRRSKITSSKIQLDSLKDNNVAEVVIEDAKSNLFENTQLIKLIYSLKRGDEVYVYDLMALIPDVNLMKFLKEKMDEVGFNFFILSEGIDTSTHDGALRFNAIYDITKTFAEYSQKIVERFEGSVASERFRFNHLDRETVGYLAEQKIKGSVITRKMNLDKNVVSRTRRAFKAFNTDSKSLNFLRKLFG